MPALRGGSTHAPLVPRHEQGRQDPGLAPKGDPFPPMLRHWAAVPFRRCSATFHFAPLADTFPLLESPPSNPTLTVHEPRQA
jgi:hypothetical protein